jgi:hypothetical protein
MSLKHRKREKDSEREKKPSVRKPIPRVKMPCLLGLGVVWRCAPKVSCVETWKASWPCCSEVRPLLIRAEVLCLNPWWLQNTRREQKRETPAGMNSLSLATWCSMPPQDSVNQKAITRCVPQSWTSRTVSSKQTSFLITHQPAVWCYWWQNMDLIKGKSLEN